MNFNVTDLIVPALIFAALLGLFFLSGVWRKKMVKKHGKVAELWFRELHAPVETLLVLTAVYGVIESLQMRWTYSPVFQQGYVIGAIAAVTWFGVRGVQLFSILAVRRFDLSKKDARARLVQAQVRVLRRLGVGLVLLVGAACILLTFPEMRMLGISLLFAAGIAGFIAGLAAQETLGNFFIGLQVALAQPVRLDDILMIEGVEGRVEEINLTFVVVKTQDQRRIVLPMRYFNKKPVMTAARVVEPAPPPPPGRAQA